MATAHSTAPGTRKQRAAAAYEAVKAWHAPVRQAIRQAVARREINHPTGEFLHWLLSQAGDKPYVALPKTEIAVLYRKSLSSIKLYLRTAVEKGFLRVSGSRIYFVQLEAPMASEQTYDELVDEATVLAAAGQILEAGLLMQRAAELRKREQEQADEQVEPEVEVVQQPLFLADDESKNCPDSDNSLPDPPIKTLTSLGGGGKKELKKLTPVALQAIQALPHVQKLKAVGSTVQQCWLRLADRPIEEIDRACELALGAKWANDPGAVAIWYADQIAAGLIPLDTAPPAPTIPADTPAASNSRDSPLDARWSRVQAALREQLPAHEFETWLAETRLIACADGQAIVGVPNIFARDKLTDSYAAHITEALSALGEAVQVQIVIDSGG